MKTAHIKIEFEVGHYNGSMGIRIINNATELFYKPNLAEDNFCFSTDIIIPGNLVIEVFGKNQFDTQVDEQNNILKDKYIKISKLFVDQMEVNFLHKLIRLETPTNIVHSNYLGFNGKVNVDFNTDDTFLWHLTHLCNTTNESSKLTFTTRVDTAVSENDYLI